MDALYQVEELLQEACPGLVGYHQRAESTDVLVVSHCTTPASTENHDIYHEKKEDEAAYGSPSHDEG
jgi:hypothetical protein